MLNSCASNVAVVNIDAGFKAGYLAGLIATRAKHCENSLRGMLIPSTITLTNRFLFCRHGSPIATKATSAARCIGRRIARHERRHRARRSGDTPRRGRSRDACRAARNPRYRRVDQPSYMTHTLSDHEGSLTVPAADEVLEMATGATAVALGPGLGRSAALTELVVRVVHRSSSRWSSMPTHFSQFLRNRRR